jgi:hypothetical protein
MRAVGHVALLLAAFRLAGIAGQEDAGAAPAPSDPDADLDLDDDLDLEDEEPGQAAGGQPQMGGAQGEPAEDFDLGMPEEDRKKRMGACFQYTVSRAQGKQELMQQTVQEMSQTHGMTPEKAMNAMVFTWMMQCYMNIDESQVAEASRHAPGTPVAIREELDQELFNQQQSQQKQNVQTASPRQWKLLEAILTEHQAKNPNPNAQSGAGARRNPRSQAPPRQAAPVREPSMFSGHNGIIFMVIVFGVIFGFSALAIGKLAQKQNSKNGDRDYRSSKSMKKAEKEERKMAKKRM